MSAFNHRSREAGLCTFENARFLSWWRRGDVVRVGMMQQDIQREPRKNKSGQHRNFKDRHRKGEGGVENGEGGRGRGT